MLPPEIDSMIGIIGSSWPSEIDEHLNISKAAIARVVERCDSILDEQSGKAAPISQREPRQSQVNFTNVPASRADASAPELPALTSLRGIAAVGVLLFHSSYYAYHFAGGSPPWLWRRGYLAVDLFFFLSGFVLTHVYGRRLTEDESWPAVG